MPELPEVETVCRGLARQLEGRRFTRIEVRRPDLRFPLPANFAARLEGRRVERITRRGKYMIVELDDAGVLLGHLGMSGRMVTGQGPPPAPGPHDHLLFQLDDAGWVQYSDARRFGFMDLTTLGDLSRHPRLADMGPEPLDNAFDGAVLGAALKGKQTPIKAALLDQRVVAGLGNIYVCEALFRAGLSPRRKAATVAGGRADRLALAIRDVLNDAIAAGGSSLRDYVQSSGELGYFQHRFMVYDREGQPCPGCDCGAPDSGGIRRITQSGRSTVYCAKRQR